MANKIMVQRETFEKNGKTYFSYFIQGVVRGINAKIQIVPPNVDTDKTVTELLTSYLAMLWKRNLSQSRSK